MPVEQKIIDEMKVVLEKEKGEIEHQLERFAKKETDAQGGFSTTFPDIGTDEEDNTSEMEMYADNVALEQTLETRLKDVSDALKRISNGSYGVCEKTGKEIPVERLRANPAARTVVGA